jgi:hypothetical protein
MMMVFCTYVNDPEGVAYIRASPWGVMRILCIPGISSQANILDPFRVGDYGKQSWLQGIIRF